jgi:hypothetical protein
MKAAGFGYSTWSAISHRAIELVCFAFVDDTDLVHSVSDPTTPTSTLIHQAQEALRTWEGLIRASGGDLAHDKSYWYLLEVIHRNGCWQFSDNENHNHTDLYLHNKGNPVPIKRLNVDQAREALGIQIRPDGSMKDQVEYLRSKAVAWSDALRTKRLTPGEAWYCLNSTIMKTIEYSLMATTISKDEMAYIMAPILSAALPKSKVQSRMPRDLVYGTLESRGLGIHNPWHTQHIEHLQSILRHTHRDNPSADLHAENMELIQCHIGTSRPFWDLPYPVYHALVPHGWMQFTWETISASPLSLRGPLRTIPPLRANDTHLMDAFIAMKYDDATLITLNNCRMFLNATLISHISTVDGLRIDASIWKDCRPIRLASKGWPNTYQPSTSDWVLWRSKLRETFLDPHATHLKLRTPLGTWTASNEDHLWWYSPTHDAVFQRTDTVSWYQWPRHNCRSRHPSYQHPSPVSTDEIPLDLQLATIHILPQRYRLNLLHALPSFTAAPQVFDSIYNILEHLPSSAHWAIQHCTIPSNGIRIAEAIRNHSALAVSDGSLKDKFGTSAFVIEAADSIQRIIGVNEVPGPLADGDSHRCELCGLFAIVLIINCLCKYHNIHAGHVTIQCDNEEAGRVFEPDFLPDPNNKTST